MDRIIQGLLKAFREEQSFNEDMSETQLFEYFVNYCLVSKEYESSFDIQEVSIGGCSDLAIDGIAILVNGDLVESTEEIEDLIKRNKSLTVKFILIQAKTSNNFDSGDIAKFLIGVRAFFDEKSTLLKNEQLPDLQLSRHASLRSFDFLTLSLIQYCVLLPRTTNFGV